MASSASALKISKDLLDRLAQEIAPTLPSQVLSFDSSGNPVLTLSQDATPAAGEKVVVIKVKPYSWSLMKDGLGLTQDVFGPHIVQICTEANFAGTTDNVADILTPVQLLPILVECAATGCVLEWHVTANGTVPSNTAIEAGTNLKKTYAGHKPRGSQAAT